MTDLITTDEEGYAMLLGYVGEEISNNDAQWAMDFIKELYSKHPEGWYLEFNGQTLWTDDLGIYLWFKDGRDFIHDTREEPVDELDNKLEMIYLANTSDFATFPLSSGQAYDPEKDKGAIEHCRALFTEMGIEVAL